MSLHSIQLISLFMRLCLFLSSFTSQNQAVILLEIVLIQILGEHQHGKQEQNMISCSVANFKKILGLKVDFMASDVWFDEMNVECINDLAPFCFLKNYDYDHKISF